MESKASAARSSSGGEGDSPPLPQPLGRAAAAYRKSPDSPSLLTVLTRAFWDEAGERIGRSCEVDDFPLSSREIAQRRNEGMIPIFVPDDLTIADLEGIFPNMGHQAFQYGRPEDDKDRKRRGWYWVENSLDCPGIRRVWGSREMQNSKKRVIFGLESYIVGSQVNKLVNGWYFDEGRTISRLVRPRVRWMS